MPVNRNSRQSIYNTNSIYLRFYIFLAFSDSPSKYPSKNLGPKEKDGFQELRLCNLKDHFPFFVKTLRKLMRLRHAMFINLFPSKKILRSSRDINYRKESAIVTIKLTANAAILIIVPQTIIPKLQPS